MERMATISSIDIGERARKDLGDLTELMESIEKLGLLQPPVITTDNKLIAGHRRIEACRALGKVAIPVIVAEDIADAVDLLRAERDENTCRKQMLPSELIALGRQIEEAERPKAKAALKAGQEAGRAAQRGDTDFVPRNKVQDEPVDTRHRTASAVGMSAGTYHRVREVVNAAEGFHESFGKRTAVEPEVQEEAKRALDLIDRVSAGEEIRTSFDSRPLTVTSIYQEWKAKAPKPAKVRTRKPDSTPVPAEQEQPKPEVDPNRTSDGRRIPARAQRKALAEGLSALSGLCAGLARIDAIDDSISAEEAGQWVADLSQSLRVLRSLTSKLKEHVNGIR